MIQLCRHQYGVFLADVSLPASQRRLHGSFRVFHFCHNLAKGDEAGEDMCVLLDCGRGDVQG